MKYGRVALSLTLFAVVACGDDGDVESDPLSPELHECTPYQAGTTSGTLSGVYTIANDKPTGSVTAPADAGGGYFELELTPVNDTLVPGMQIRASGDTSGVIISTSAAGTTTPGMKRAGFSAAPGQSYDLTFTQAVNASPDDYPVGYNMDWTFTGIMDCYEPNDTATEAQQVPVGTTIDAFAMAGYTSNTLLAVEFDDWYRIVLNRGATIEAALTMPPGDEPGNHRMRIRFWEVDGTTELANNGGNAGGETFATTATLSAGTYLMSVEVANAEDAKRDNDDDPPAFWSQPYRVSLREVL